MTAEAIVMNRSAVALAADSAVTIANRRTMKTYESANKLFELIKGSNIGVMVYSSATVDGTPWETVIKTYRQERGATPMSHVEDYAEDFLDFLAGHTGLITDDAELETAMSIGYQFLLDQIIQRLVEWPDDLASSTGRIVQTRVKAALDSILNDIEAEIDALEAISSNAAFPAALKRQFKEPLAKLVELELDENGLKVSRSQINRAATLITKAMAKKGGSQSDSGLVFAGFGTADYFPKRFSTRISGRFCGTVGRYSDSLIEISPSYGGHWETFAQDGPAQGWVNGITDEMRQAIVNKWVGWVRDQLPKDAIDGLKKEGFTAADAKKATGVFHSLTVDALQEFGHFMGDWENNYYRIPMQASVTMLPKDELGLLAESLVNITSTRQRMSVHQQNTVGGAIDVALISIGDGFIWLNRKHYFDNTLNPTWHLTHGATIRTT